MDGKIHTLDVHGQPVGRYFRIVSKKSREARRAQRETVRAPASGALPTWTPWVLCAVTLLVFIRSTSNQFINLDDDAYITANPHVLGGLTGANVWWALTNLGYFVWQPLAWLSHQLDVTLFGLDPGPPHVINAVIHAMNAGVCFLLLRRITNNDWGALVGAAIWALHPLRVESVAWAAERKDVLSVFFYLLAVLWYVERRPFWQTTLIFALGLAAKPTLVSFPVVVTLLDLWPLKRWNLREKIPWFAMAIVLSLITVKGAATMGATAALGELPSDCEYPTRSGATCCTSSRPCGPLASVSSTRTTCRSQRGNRSLASRFSRRAAPLHGRGASDSLARRSVGCGTSSRSRR